MHYVYILESEAVPGHFYIGSTDNLRQRLRQHQVDVDAYAARQPVAAVRDRVVDSMVGKSFLRDRVVGHE
jgi:predicted GIY-YIG superfamily endonuclease